MSTKFFISPRCNIRRAHTCGIWCGEVHELAEGEEVPQVGTWPMGTLRPVTLFQTREQAEMAKGLAWRRTLLALSGR